jgi:hypothetical protein
MEPCSRGESQRIEIPQQEVPPIAGPAAKHESDGSFPGDQDVKPACRLVFTIHSDMFSFSNKTRHRCRGKFAAASAR